MAGYHLYTNKLAVSEKREAILEIARVVNIWSMKDIVLLLTQSIMFTSTVNALPKFPIKNSTLRVVNTM